MDELYGIHSSLISRANNVNIFGFDDENDDEDDDNITTGGFEQTINNNNRNSNGVDNNLIITRRFQTTTVESDISGGAAGSQMSDLIKAQITSHPLYPSLVSAYIECRKVGAPPEMASLLEEINKESLPITTCSDIGNDPELDQFMESYCEVLQRYKEELSKPFDEATIFLNNIESQLNSLCTENVTAKATATTSSLTSGIHLSDEVGGTSDEELISRGEAEVGDESQKCSGVGGGEQQRPQQKGENELKEMLMKKYSGYLTSLKKEFLKKRKTGKLPKDASITLMDWWNTHYRWPYPTEEEKTKLSEVTGLEQKQINNWFINQRKRHWRPSEDMRFALMEGVTTTSATINKNNNIFFFDHASVAEERGQPATTSTTSLGF